MIDEKDMNLHGFLTTLLSGMRKTDEIAEIFKNDYQVPDENGNVKVPIDAEVLHDISCLFSKATIILAYLGSPVRKQDAG